MSAGRPLGWWEGASITASSRGDRRKSSPPEYCCCSCPRTCYGRVRFLESAGDAVSGSSCERCRNQQEYISKLKYAWKSMFGERSCHKLLNSSSERILQFEWKTPGKCYHEAALQQSMLCIYYALITQLVGIAHLLTQMNTIALQTGFRITGDKKNVLFLYRALNK